jgi:hypothetical protein
VPELDEEFFAIMLDDWLEIFPDQWPLTATASSIQELRRMSQHDREPELVPRSRFRAILRENKTLRNRATGQLDRGGIYQLLSGEGLFN